MGKTPSVLEGKESKSLHVWILYLSSVTPFGACTHGRAFSSLAFLLLLLLLHFAYKGTVASDSFPPLNPTCGGLNSPRIVPSNYHTNNWSIAGTFLPALPPFIQTCLIHPPILFNK